MISVAKKTTPLPPTLDNNPEVKREGSEDEIEFRDNAHGQGETTPLPLTFDNDPEVKREESEEESKFCKAGCEEECGEGCPECAEGCPECVEGCPECAERCPECAGCPECEDCGFEQGFEESEREDGRMVAELVRRVMKRIPEENLNKMPENIFKAMKRIMRNLVNKMLENMLQAMFKAMKWIMEEASEQDAGEYAHVYGEDYEKDYEEASEQETGEYAQGYEEDYEETVEGYDGAANFTFSHNQLKHKTPSSHRKMGTGVDIENQKHTALSCSHCQGTDRESNCPVLTCSCRKENGHVSLLCPERLAKARKSKNTEMWIRRQSEAEGSAPVASGGNTSQQSEGTNAENPRKRKSRASPATPTSSDHE